MRGLLATLLASVALVACAEAPSRDLYGTSSCMGCHGTTAMGGLGPPIARTRLPREEFVKVVRNGKGMMPATPAAQLSDADLDETYGELQAKKWNPDDIPIAFKAGGLLTTRNVAMIFLGVTLFSAVFAFRGIVYWVGLAGLKQMRPALRKFGYFKALGVFLWSLIVDSLLVSSLWKSSKHRWFMHGLMLYGMLGLMAADVLIQVFNPTRADLALSAPLKVLPIVSGIAVLVGVLYVMVRYKTDEFVDNGLTLGRDYLFVTLLFHTVLSGILTLVINRTTAFGWVMPIYIYHLLSIAALLVSAPFTRFQHAWIVPIMAGLNRVTDAVAAAGHDIGFVREPSPGRHHKSERIALDVVRRLSPDQSDDVKLRYYP
ncbi:MAG: c-type cytochrome [Fimbriimonadaceae bacterium]